MTSYHLVASPEVDLDVEAVFDWYERQKDDAVYFAIDGLAIVALTVLHASRDPALWQLRSGLQVHEPAMR